MVKNTIKKMKVSKVALGKDVSSSAVVPVSEGYSLETKSKTKLFQNGSTKAITEIDKPVTFPAGSRIKRLREEDKFISGLLDLIRFPKNHDSDDEFEDEETVARVTNVKKHHTVRATSVGELHERLSIKLQELRGNQKNGEAKPKLTKAERKLKAKEEKRLKSKISKLKTSSDSFNNKMTKAAQKVGAKPAKRVFNADGKMVFSKFDFTDDSGFKADDNTKKQALDPKSALAKLEKQKEKIKTLEEQGKGEKARAIEDNSAWRTALDRSSGVTVKDDVTLLKKSIKKQERRKKISKKNWEQRTEKEENRKTQKQQKRSENLAKRKKDKKDKMRKKASKKGKMTPGFR